MVSAAVLCTRAQCHGWGYRAGGESRAAALHQRSFAPSVLECWQTPKLLWSVRFTVIILCLSKTLVPKTWLRRDLVYFLGGRKKIGLRVVECAVSHISGSGKYAYSLGTSPSLSALPKEPCGEISGEGFHGFFPECSEFSDLKGKRGKSLNSTAGELNVSGLLIILYIMPWSPQKVLEVKLSFPSQLL